MKIRLLREHLMKEPDAEEQEVWLSGELLDESMNEPGLSIHIQIHALHFG